MGDHSHHGHGGGHGAHDHAGHGGMMDMTTSSSTPSPATIIGGDHGDHSGHHMDHGSGHGDGGTMGHGMMHMYFHGGVNETILFEFWKTSDTWGLILSMLLIFLLAFAYEGLKFYREHLYRHSFQTVQLSTVAVPVENGTMRETHKTVQVKILSMMHCWQTVLHIFQMIISYFLMLIFMTYNVWLCLAVAVGAGAGYFCFGWKKSVVVDVTEHCH